MPLARPNNPHPFRRRARTALLFLGAFLFLIEEWLWICSNQVFGWFSRFGLLRWLDRWLCSLAPAAALLILCVPIGLLFPLKILGLWMIASGSFLSGCCVMLAAKIVSTAIVARIFLACRPQLLQMSWFARLHNLALVLRDRIHRWMAQQPAWRDARRWTARMRRQVSRWFGAGGADGERRNGVLRRWRRTRRKTVLAQMPHPSGGRSGRDRR